MKQVSESINTDIESICVDSTEIRDRLLDDEKYSITEVPAVLIVYSSGQHKIYNSSNLDKWFEQLLQNIYQEQQQLIMQQQPPPQTQLPIQSIDGNIPKPLRRKPGGGGIDIPTSLPSPGKPLIDQGTTSLISGGGSGMAGTGAQAAMVQQHIRQPEPTVPIESQLAQPTPKEVKSEGLSAKELARQMEDQREQFDEQIEQNRPFL